jgi:type II secretory pathway pseudopilin PulG|tara:strand:+ start:16 stop:666 length:651 start_codon:yes stop_codon:yes gene_type:complete
MLKQKENKAFTLIEILVVILIIIIFVIFAAPNVANYGTDREVKKEVYRFVEYFEQRKTDVQSGKYGIYYVKPGMNSTSTAKNYYFTPGEFNIQMKAGKFSGRACPGSPGGSSWGNWQVDNNVFRWSSDVNMWMNKGYCISPDAILNPGELEHTVPAGQMSFIVCSTTNTADHNSANNNTICNFNNKKEFRYAVGIYRDLSIKIYKYNLKKDKWLLQ